MAQLSGFARNKRKEITHTHAEEDHEIVNENVSNTCQLDTAYAQRAKFLLIVKIPSLSNSSLSHLVKLAKDILWTATVNMATIPVYKISTAKNGKLPKHSEVFQDQEINPSGFAYARDMPKDEQNYTWYAVAEDEQLLLLTIEDLVVEKEGTMLYLPVWTHSPFRVLFYSICMHACRSGIVVQESLSKATLSFEDLEALTKEPSVVKIKALAILPPPTQ